MANGENRVVSHIREQMKSAHWLLEETISDVSGEMARTDTLPHFRTPNYRGKWTCPR